MKKNYFLKNATKTSTPLVLNCEKKTWKNTLTGLFLFLFTFLGFSDVFGQTTTVTTPGNYTFTVPCDVTSITVQAWGAGGGGYGDDNNNNVTGRGGGGSPGVAGVCGYIVG